MITGLEGLLKWTPIAGAILMAAIGYGNLSTDVRNLQALNSQEFQLIETQLAAIHYQLEEHVVHANATFVKKSDNN